jgi:C4-dicarboxylate-specific signal transduction histidine kinase
MMTMDELAVSIAHEVNQPLMAIVTNAGTCLRWLDDGQLDVAMAREAAGRIVRDGHRAGEIVTSIRALARKAAPRMEKLDLEQVIQEVLDLLRGELQRRGIVSKTEFSEAVPSIYGDSTQLQQVVLNLVMKGVEAMAQVDDGDRRLTVRLLQHQARRDRDGPVDLPLDRGSAWRPHPGGEQSSAGQRLQLHLAIGRRSPDPCPISLRRAGRSSSW